MRSVVTRGRLNPGRIASLAIGFGLLFAGLCAPAGAFEPVPEIDAGSMVSALSLLTGGLLILTARRGK